ncbi:MAG: hypothetical protein SWC40_06435 [Thermodesulfobacteriota bacterium]|nr:hypothetical protein [Thermodesulfobacteriota bacterium]
MAGVKKELGIAPEERMVLLTTGGGGDGFPVLNTFLVAFERRKLPEDARVVVVTGPFLSNLHFKEVHRRCRAMGFVTLKKGGGGEGEPAASGRAPRSSGGHREDWSASNRGGR